MEEPMGDSEAEMSPAEAPLAHIAALDALDNVAQRPLAEHIEVYEQLHRELQATLARIETA